MTQEKEGDIHTGNNSAQPHCQTGQIRRASSGQKAIRQDESSRNTTCRRHPPVCSPKRRRSRRTRTTPWQMEKDRASSKMS